MPIDIYSGWTPLRNALRKLDLNDTLGVIRAYTAHTMLRTKTPFPSNMEVHPSVFRDERVILPWELEILVREALIVCGRDPYTQYTLRKWNTFANLVDKLRVLNNYISEVAVNQTTILQEVTVRLAHLQFKYQTDHPSVAGLTRYSRVFGHPAVEPILQTKTGLSSKQLFTVGMVLWVNYAQYLGMNYPLDELALPDVTYADYDRFMQMYSLPLEVIRQRLTDERKLDDTFMYQFHALQSYPLILTELNGRQAHICPVPTLLFWRITSGLYYDLVKEQGFDQAFGTSFQEYVGAMLSKTFEGNAVTVYPEEPDIRRKRADWVIDQPSAFLLVECKTKRITEGARTVLRNDETNELQVQLEKISEAVVQAYQAFEVYKSGQYRQQCYPYDPAKNAYICVVTLENWRLMGPQLESLRIIARRKLQEEGLEAQLMDQVPFVVCSINEMEEFAYLLKTHTLTGIVDRYWTDPEESQWAFISYLHHHYKDELRSYSYVFADEFANVFTLQLRSQGRTLS